MGLYPELLFNKVRANAIDGPPSALQAIDHPLTRVAVDQPGLVLRRADRRVPISDR